MDWLVRWPGKMGLFPPAPLLSDHPLTPERARRLAEEDATASGPELLGAQEWLALRAICR
jgi:hypothetical protein